MIIIVSLQVTFFIRHIWHIFDILLKVTCTVYRSHDEQLYRMTIIIEKLRVVMEKSVTVTVYMYLNLKFYVITTLFRWIKSSDRLLNLLINKELKTTYISVFLWRLVSPAPHDICSVRLTRRLCCVCVSIFVISSVSHFFLPVRLLAEM